MRQVTRMSDQRCTINGRPATLEDLRSVALVNYGHFTAMQVLDGRVRGIDLHLQRLERSTLELFGCPLDLDATREQMRRAVDGTGGMLSLRVNVFSRHLDRDRLTKPVQPDVLVSTGPSRQIPQTPVRVRSVIYERDSPHIKHVGTFGLLNQKRLAQVAGFDDALFVDGTGAISEGSIWNVGFFDGTQIVWPNAPALDGTAMQLLKVGIRARSVRCVTRRVARADVAQFRSAFFTNSACAALPISQIDGVEMTLDTALLATLDECLQVSPWEPL
jgi:branched-subunit amino acid aminotransferase/4-amino-4-deoxychorismate lyase